MSNKVPKDEVIEQIEEIIRDLKETVKELKKSKHTEVTIYSNTDNGGYSDDPSIVDEVSFSCQVDCDDEEEGLVVGLCLVV